MSAPDSARDEPLLLPADVGEHEDVVRTESSRSSQRIESASESMRRINFARVMEYTLSGGMALAELYWDVSKFPDHYSSVGFTAYTRETVPQLHNEAMFTQLGDILEIGIGSGIGRLSLAIIEQMLRAEPIRKLVRNTMQNEKIQSLVTKTVGTARSDELSKTGEMKMLTDDQQFWAALVPWTIIKAAHSLGAISLGANDHIGAPVEFMLKGQALACAVLIATHYGAKRLPEIIDFTRKSFESIDNFANGALKKTDDIVKQLEKKVKSPHSDIWFDKANQNLDSFYDMVENWRKGLEQLDSDNVIENLLTRIVGERSWKAVSRIEVEHVVDEERENS